MLLEKIQLEPDESILLQTHRHWFVIASQLASLLGLALGPILMYVFVDWFLHTTENFSFNLTELTAELLFVYLLWLLFLWLGTFNLWTNYYLDILTVTDRRVILINQKGFFRRNVSSFRLERLQDMNIEVDGLLATLLDYGTVHAETAGHADEEFRATGLPKPRDIKSLILRASDNRIPTTTNHQDPL